MATIMDLLRAHLAHSTHFNHIHLSACWMSLGRLAKQRPAELQSLQVHAEALEPLVQNTMCAAAAGNIGARQLANIAYGAAVALAKAGR